MNLQRITGKLVRFRRMIRDLDLSDGIHFLKKSDVLLFCHDVNRGITLNARAYSPLLDSVVEELQNEGLSCQVIAHPFSRLTGAKAHREPISINRSYLFARLRDRFGETLGAPNSAVSNLYSRILQRVQPQLIVSIGAPHKLCEAARALGIFHAELLHGIGYKPIPWGWASAKPENLPQGILSLDDISTATFQPLRRHGIRTVTIRHPFLRRFQEPSECENLPTEWLLSKDSSEASAAAKKRILVSLQWGYAGDHGSNIQFEDILKNGLFPEELSAAVKSTVDSVFWHFRFHPVQLRKPFYRSQMRFMERFVSENHNAEWIDASTLPFPSIASICDGQVTMSSMSAYDASYLGLSTLFLCPTVRTGTYQGMFQDLVEESYAQKVAASEPTISHWAQSAERGAKRILHHAEAPGSVSALRLMSGLAL